MADTILLFITGWTVLYILLNGICDKDYEGNNLCSRFPYQARNVGNWFQQKDSERETGRINMLNLLLRDKPETTYEYPRQQYGAVFPSPVEAVEGYRMLYHGTSHEHAQSILKDGIHLFESDEKGDFSCGKGFYLTKNFEKAVDYAFSRSPNAAAVLGFKIPDNVQEKFRNKSKNLMGKENKEEWLHVVKNIEEILSEEEYNFIEGPEMGRTADTNEKTYEQLPGTHQLCILHEDMAAAYNKHLDSVVYYATPEAD